MSEATQSAGKERTLTARVASARMDKTVAVVVERMVRHPVYGKFLRRSTRLLAHDESNECRRGDLVTITPCRPMSRRKSWRVASVVERAGGSPAAAAGNGAEA